ncbi:MAG: response regulator transcription factor [Firmicutes bacterium]|jgi:DNA-binding NarL/FixJ family response regulator|uniref:Stage 0 sporulation protein A homolog n=1 Tax=Sulfobacillus benefaciens TaxID=453960 RepID=A0A2T2X2Z1_9FIRM|nr:response regulator transcription factor [Bacillota bacterium]MCL5014549.1 response regulator transcription factor [Bacillota bacterium]PSR28864.1 MAG: DNA-binding response regulator [Sulfobacillus benefaciens]HBQ96683.1 DNA-binding response regulator [Sulfobacillus sp.]
MLVDDHALFRSGMASLLAGRPDMEVVGEAQTGEEAVRLAEELMPDLILMDINMPGDGGLEATRIIKEQMPYVRIVVLTASDENDLLFEAVKAGAQGYLLKHLDPEQFLEELSAQIRGEASISGDVALKIIRAFSTQDVERQQTQLTGRELEVLKLVGEGYSNRDIASRLFISENTVKNHLRNILQKLHFENRVQAAAYAIRRGIVDPHKS